MLMLIATKVLFSKELVMISVTDNNILLIKVIGNTSDFGKLCKTLYFKVILRVGVSQMFVYLVYIPNSHFYSF